MSYKLAVGQKIRVPVKFTVPHEGKMRTFKFILLCDRITVDEWQKRIENDEGVVQNALVRQLLLDLATGWEGQELVLDEESGQPAEFCTEAFEVMIGLPGVLTVITQAYMKEGQASAKN